MVVKYEVVENSKIQIKLVSEDDIEILALRAFQNATPTFSLNEENDLVATLEASRP